MLITVADYSKYQVRLLVVLHQLIRNDKVVHEVATQKDIIYMSITNSRICVGFGDHRLSAYDLATFIPTVPPQCLPALLRLVNRA